MKEITVGEYKRVDKRVARGMFDIGKEVIMCASNMRLEYGISTANNMGSFDNTCNHFSYYNCNKETGHRINFFVKSEELLEYHNESESEKKERIKEYRKANRAKHNEYQRKYARLHPERVKQSVAMYQAKYPERVKSSIRRWQLRNVEYINRRKLEYYKKRRYTGNAGNIWTEYETEIVMEHKTTDDKIAGQLGRSVQAIQVRRSKVNSGLV